MQSSRLISYKVWISDLVTGQYVKEAGEWDPNYILIKDKKVSRVNLIANVVMKYQNETNTYLSIVVDDGSETMRLKTWNEDVNLLKNINIGDVILIIGRPRSYNNEIYLIPEIVKKIDNLDWQLLRKLELTKEYGKPVKTERILEQTEEKPVEKIENIEIHEEPKMLSSSRQKILDFISKKEEGMSIQEIMQNSAVAKEETEKIINQLIKEGEIFESRPNVIRLI